MGPAAWVTGGCLWEDLYLLGMPPERLLHTTMAAVPLEDLYGGL